MAKMVFMTKEENNEENQEEREDSLTENLEAVGQMIIGGIEQIGGTLTADGITREEGEYNTQAGALHQEANKKLTAAENREEAEREKTAE